MKNPTRVLALGLDSFDPDLMLSLIERGVMPNLGKLLQKAQHGKLSTGTALGDDSVWASAYTGCSLETHGKYYYHVLRKSSYKLQYWKNEMLGARPFWEHLSNRGNKVAIIDVPKCPLSSGLYGLQVCNWYVHGQETPLQTTPAELKEHLGKRYGKDPVDCTFDPKTYICKEEKLEGDLRDQVVRAAFETMRKKSDFCMRQLEQGGWDLFLACFKEAHCLLHQLWDELDLLDPFFEELDKVMQGLIEAAGEQAVILLFTNLGMEKNISANHLLDDVLKRLEPWSLPWRRRAYALPHNTMSGAIRLSVKGRDKGGVLNPGKELEEYAERTSEEILELRNPETDELVVEEIVKSGNQLTHATAGWLPDLFVVWRKKGPVINAVQSSGVGTVRGVAPNLRVGNHKPGGYYFAAGAGIIPGRVDGAIEDVASTICSMVGEPLERVEGKALCKIGAAKPLSECGEFIYRFPMN